MSKSIKRVEQAAADLGLKISVERMPESTRTAKEAAAACGGEVGQIVKSLIFEGEMSGELILLLVSGGHDVDLKKVSKIIGETLKRADPNRIRKETGFAIGGVAPIGHLIPIKTYFDNVLFTYENIWAAAGAPNAVFNTNTQNLFDVIEAELIVVS
ncbi:MAG: YbaK/EbsC family protein [Kordiimonadaceae bacterium]|nr:YbaK/EbsC family protein [Kordiimonadaceae bacterium]